MTEKRSPIYDDEIKIDFGKYIETLVRQWQWIVACALVLGILVLAYSLFTNRTSPPSYQAVALVSSAKTESNVNYGSAITSVSEADLAFYNRNARLQTFVLLVHNGAVAEQVLAEIGPRLKENERTPATLLGMVKANLIPSTDTIQISVIYSDPIIAAEIANAWGKAYVNLINELYVSSSTGTSYLATEAQTTLTKTAYDQAQSALDDFLVHNKIDENKRQLDEVTITITSLRDAQSKVDNQQIQDRQARLDQAYSDSRQIGRFLDNAVSMRAAVNAGGEPAAISNALALTMLKIQMYAAFQGTNTLQEQSLPEPPGSNISTNLQIQNLPEAQIPNLPESLGSSITSVNAAGMVADLDALISSLKTRQTELTTRIGTLSSEIQNGDYLMNLSIANTLVEKKIEDYEQKIRDLNSMINADTGTLNELTQARDLAWQSYTALATKSTEMSVAAQTTGIEVVFASPAIPPGATVSQASRNLPNAGLATGVGFLIGIVVAYAYEFWQNYKGRQPEIISEKLFAYAKNLVYKGPIKLQKKLK